MRLLGGVLPHIWIEGLFLSSRSSIGFPVLRISCPGLRERFPFSGAGGSL
jgi:hypothetical protein